MRAIPHSRLNSYIWGNVSSPFKCKERFCDSVSFGIIPSWVQRCRVLFSNYFVFAKLYRGKPMDLLSRLFIFSPMKENKKFSHKCIHRIHFRVRGIKSSNVVTKETSQILLQTLWHLRKPQINSVSLRGDYFTDVGYIIGQVATLLDRSLLFSLVLIDINGSNLITTCYSETQLDYLIIKLVIVYRWYENLPFEWNKIIPLPFVL